MPKIKCTCCGETFYTAPREDPFDDYCPKCALEMDFYHARIADLQRVIETWRKEAGLSTFELSEVLEAVNTRSHIVAQESE